MRDDRNSRLPTGYTPDLVGDLCIIVPHNPDGKIVARLHRMVDPEEVRRAAEEDREKGFTIAIHASMWEGYSRLSLSGTIDEKPLRLRGCRGTLWAR